MTEIAFLLYDGMTALDMALTLAERIAGRDDARALQLVIEYDPQPPYDSGSFEKADAETRQRAGESLARALAER
jgi:hypothetical protein